MKNYNRHMFPGGNTSKGFHSFFGYILPQEDARRIICLKGGPGTGKSSLMKNIAAHFYEEGYTVEQHHCSSDYHSLDAVVIKGLNAAVLDGTAPHVTDPVAPGAVDEIINLGICWNEEGLKENRKEIIQINNTLSKNYKMIYRYLGAAKLIHEDWSSINAEALDNNKLLAFKEELKENILGTIPVSILGRDRNLFATGITPQGIITFIENLTEDYKNIYVLNGSPGSGKSEVLKYLIQECLKRGMFVEVYHDPFIPERIEHILIPELSTAVITSNEINKKQFEGTQIYMEDFCHKAYIDRFSKEIEYNKSLFYSMTDKALTILKDNKALHDELEKYYMKSMDYGKLNELEKTLLQKLLKLHIEYKTS